jgi:hypothetical protein
MRELSPIGSVNRAFSRTRAMRLARKVRDFLSAGKLARLLLLCRPQWRSRHYKSISAGTSRYKMEECYGW